MKYGHLSIFYVIMEVICLYPNNNIGLLNSLVDCSGFNSVRHVKIQAIVIRTLPKGVGCNWVV